MIDRITSQSLKTPGLIILAVLAVIGVGIMQYRSMPVDAFPDISPVMVPVFAEGHGMAPEEIERLITYPIESAMNGLPGVTEVKSTSAFGMAVVYVYFTDSTDIYFARQIVAERMASIIGQLPKLDEPPTLGPISTGLGQIYFYYLKADPAVADTEGKPVDTWLREINDWIVKFKLQAVPGVTEILSMGGHVLQYQIHVNPNALLKYKLTLQDIVEAVNANNRNVGGQFLVIGAEEHLVRGIGLLEGLEDISNIQIKEGNGRSIMLRDVARVEFGNEIRRGVVTRNGEEEVVCGIIMKLFGENTSKVIKLLNEKVEDVKQTLPKGVTLVPYYEQAELVRKATGTVTEALLIGAVLVIITLVLFLGNLRTSFIVALALPICAFFAVIGMRLQGISANLMSLGGIAIAVGMLGDGAIVMVENIFRHLGDARLANRSKKEIIAAAASEVNRPIVFSIAIIIAVFLPLFTLQGVEGKMFSPMAITISFALLGSALVAVTVAPVLSFYLLKRQPEKEMFFIRWLKGGYRVLLHGAIRFKIIIISLAIVALIASLMVVPRLGTEFIPTLEEGSILIGVNMAPSISLEEGTKIIMAIEREIKPLEPVIEIVSRIGRPEAGSHPHPVNTAEVQIELKPFNEWKEFKSKRELIAEIEERLADFPGIQITFTQPIQNVFDELQSGTKAQLAIKIFGEDLEILRAKATEVQEAIEDVRGLVDLSAEQNFGQPQVQIIANREACTRYGVTVDEIMEMVELAIGGEIIDNIYLNTRRFAIHLRFDEPFRSDSEAIGNLLVSSSNGMLMPLSQVAEIREVTGPIQISREKNQRRWIVHGNVRGRDLGSVVADIKAKVAGEVDLPSGYTIEYGGQFENQQRAMRRLAIIVPIVIVLVLIMVWMSFGNFRHAAIIIMNVPLALVGGVAGLLITGEYLSVPASVGFIALFGIAVQNGMVLVTYFNDLQREGIALHEAVRNGAVLRLRPVLMTALTTVLGLLPLLLSKGIGSDVQRPLAIVVVYGLTSSTLLTLFVIPAVYIWVEEIKARLVAKKEIVMS